MPHTQAESWAAPLRGAVLLLIALAACLAPGCQAPNYSRLVPESDCAQVADLRAADAALSRSCQMVPTIAGRQTPVEIALHDLRPAGAPARRSAIIMIHGVLADCESWRF